MGLVERRQVLLDYAPRAQFMPFHERTARWACLVCHRRAGKTVACINDQIKRAVVENKPDGRYGFVMPLRTQVKEVAWDYLKRYAEPLLADKPSESDLRVRLIGGQQIRLYGADNPNALRGGYFDGIVLDEFADMRPSLWTDVVRPMLSDRQGWATIIGTPKGKNGFYDLYAGDTEGRFVGAKNHKDWFALMLRASESGITGQSELDSMLIDMGADRYAQELECSFEVAIRGAFYAEQLGRALEQKRIRPLQVDRAARVHTAWDLGRRDSTAIWFIQVIGAERHWIDYYEGSGCTLDHYVQVLEEKKRSRANPDGYIYGKHYFPHDVKVHELLTQKSRYETLCDLGIEPEVVPDHNVLDGINVMRRTLDRSFIDPVKCHRGLEAVRQYRREWSDQLKDWRNDALHDWSSHGADAARMFAVGHDEPTPEKQEDRTRRGRGGVVESAWGV